MNDLSELIQPKSLPMPMVFMTGHDGAIKWLKTLMGKDYCFRNIREAFKRGMIDNHEGMYIFNISHETVFA